MPWERPKVTRMSRRARWWMAVVTLAAAVFCAGFIVVPYVESHAHGAGHLLRLAYRPGCHQMPQRCLDLGSGPLAVCARCAGLYVGGLLGLVMSTVSGRCIRLQPRWLAIALIPSVIDFSAGVIGLPSLSNWMRFGISLPVGALCGLLLSIGIADTVDFGRLGPSTPRDPVQ